MNIQSPENNSRCLWNNFMDYHKKTTEKSLTQRDRYWVVKAKDSSAWVVKHCFCEGSV